MPNESFTGSSLLDKSKAHPGNIDMSVFAPKSKPPAQGTVNSNYLRETREQNPDPAEAKKDEAKVSLSKCRFVTPLEDLRLNEPFEFAVDVKKTGEPKSMSPSFDLYCTRTRDGKPERDRIWAGQEGKPLDPKADPLVVQGKDVLATQADYVLGETVTFELEATHPEADQPAKSEPAEIQIKGLAHWIGGDDLFFRNDGEFPLLGSEGSLPQVLATAVERIRKPAQEGETCICFGFASSAGEAGPNRELSLRRAQAVKALLDRDEASWVELAKANFETVDIQQFLADLRAACGWECDPGAVDGQDGPKTKAAIEAFQQECNARYKLGLAEDGVCGSKTWGAVHRVILRQVQAVRGEDEAKAPSWPKPKWGNRGKGVHANGEDYATGGDKPEERSVQITFFAPGSEPPLKEVADGQKPSNDDNPVQQPDRIEKKKVEKGGEVKRGGAARLVSCTSILRCPELPGSAVFKAIDGLWLHLVDDRNSVQYARLEDGVLKDPSNKLLEVDSAKTYGVFVSHRKEAIDESLLAAVKKSAIVATGKELAGTEAKIDIWAQNNFLIRTQNPTSRSLTPYLAELPTSYTVGYIASNGKFYGYPNSRVPVKPESYRGSAPVPMVEWTTTRGVFHVAVRYDPGAKPVKILLASVKAPQVAFSSINQCGDSGNLIIPFHHSYKGTLVDQLAKAAASKNFSSLPKPPASSCLPGDIIWQTQGQTNNCGAYSFSAMMNYWYPERAGNGGAEWAERIPSIVPFYNNAARVPGHLVHAATANNLKAWLFDDDLFGSESVALRTLKLWIHAGVPVIVLVNEAPGEFGLHWKIVVGYDETRLLFNNSGGDWESGKPLIKAPDHLHAPTGNDVDATERFLWKWREASVPLVAGKYTMLPMIPTGATFRGNEAI